MAPHFEYDPGMTYRTITVGPVSGGRPPREGELVVALDQGKVFGTGHHETTSLCLALLGGLYADAGPKPRRVLDVGCGTGVLSVACALLGAERVRGVDVAEDSPRVATGNAERNGVAAKCTFDLTPLAAVGGAHDLVLANILAPVLRELCGDLCAQAKGGRLVLSGFKDHEHDELLARFTANGLKLRADTQAAEWCAALLVG